MYLATYRVLSEGYEIDDFGKNLRIAYLNVFPDMENRGIGITTKRNLNVQKNIKWDKLQYNSDDSGSGAAMRSGCIGMFFPGHHNRKKLIAYAVECSRITHNSATAILGSIVAALFTAYGLEKLSINLWPHELLKLFKSGIIDDYMKESRPKEYPIFSRDKHIFIGKWENYVGKRFNGINPKNEKWMKNPVERYRYLKENYSKGNDFPGSNGDDSVIMAYDALLESGNVVEKIIVYAILHPGDSDTVGSIALSWFGAYYQSPRIFETLRSKFFELEYLNEINKINQTNTKMMTHIFFYDIYLNIANKYINLYAIPKNK
jgi:ADP-ribosylglycohydrolase